MSRDWDRVFSDHVVESGWESITEKLTRKSPNACKQSNAFINNLFVKGKITVESRKYLEVHYNEDMTHLNCKMQQKSYLEGNL